MLNVDSEVAAKAKLLVVDDHPDNLRTLSLILQAEGYKVRKATSGAMALETIRTQLPDLILLDIRMPKMDGFEVCATLKQSAQTCEIPILFISASNEVDEKVKAFELGGADYITKPFRAKEVLARIQHQLTIQSQYQQLLKLAQQLQHFNTDLERQIQARTLELEQALRFEQSLKRITDQVRDTLDQHQILRNAVKELATALGASCCSAVLYSPDRLTSTIRYQHPQPSQSERQERTLHMADAPEIHEQLHQRYTFAFCPLQTAATDNHTAILACPIFDNQVEQKGILGDLWVLKPEFSSFSELEVHLVEQVANQCAIALRQAKLYESSQRQVAELEQLNHLKDSFLNTISHELRSPLSNMNLALQMLDLLTQQGQTTVEHTAQPGTPNKAAQYFEILKQECDRELQLVNDLLELQHLEAGNSHIVEPIVVNLYHWLPHVIEAFQMQAQTQQQILQLTMDDNLPLLTVDLSALSRVITELLNNACKYTPANETITVAANLEETIVCLRVINSGVEISTTELTRIFDKFYRIPNNDPWKQGGTGLGLALVRKLVEQLEGSITVESCHQTVCFTVHLPTSNCRDLS
ncbi:response regulator [Oscillatoria sp. FACHB-1407]|uniref:response regulator n=1 Tax=Oscillatoria sp. FACHB-1407 TaxID=2692847 RepID=UPI001687624E|nr:response regulator [Oscillatoria sp. FACHB-1407]MBD2464440.1 response regulator [Oscillatoria sp. FACHB-1407]